MPRLTISRRSASIGALSSLAAPFAPAIGQSTKKITFVLDVPVYSKHALFYPAIEKGYFAKRGLEVSFNAGKGSSDAAQHVASGSGDFGFVDAGSAILARGRGLPLKLVCMVHYQNMMAMVGLGEPPLLKPKDLEGRKVAAAPGDSIRTGFAAIAKANNVDLNKVAYVTTESANKRTLLFAGKVGAVCDYAVNFPVYAAAAARTGAKVSQVLFSDFGLDIYSNGVVTREDVIKSNPTLVKNFNDALVESMMFAVANPDEAVRIYIKYNQQADPILTRAGLDVAIDHLLVPEVQEHGIGPMTVSKMQKTIDAMKEYYDLAANVSTSDISSNDFVTAGSIPPRKPA